MTTPEHQHPPRRTARRPITAMFGGVALAASVMFGTAVGPAAAAETPAQIIAGVCGNYVPNPTQTSYTSCFHRDLTGTNLAGVNLANAELGLSTLTNANLTNANLTNAFLTNADLTGADLTGADLTGADLTGATLTRSSALPADITVPAESAAGATVTWATPTLPTGLTLNYCAPISGTVFGIGTTSVTCSVSSMNNGIRTTGLGTVTVTVTPYTEAPSFVTPPTQPLPAVAGTPFSHSIGVTGSPDPTLSLAGQPGWLTLTDEHLTGTPTEVGPVTFTITATNGTTPNATLQVTVNVTAAPVAPSFVNPPQSPLNAVANSPFTPYTFTATGTPTPTITITDPAKLPPGMTFGNDPVTGIPTLTGTPSTAGSYPFTVSASNGTAPNATLQVTVNVTAVPTFTAAPTFTNPPAEPLPAVVGTPFSHTFTATGTPDPTLTVVDPATLPPGTTFTNDPVTGVPTLSGTPTVAGKFDFMVTATNGTTPNATLQVTVNVTAAPVVEPPVTGSLGSLGSSFFGFGS